MGISVLISTSDKHVLTVVRREILNGTRAPGEHISEAAIARDLDISRTPARTALAALEAEGLIEKREGRGFTICSISAADVANAIEVRAVLEGLAASALAQSGMSDAVADALLHSIRITAELLNSDEPDVDAFGVYQDANKLFHQTIFDGCGNALIAHTFERIAMLPMTALGTLAIKKMDFRRERMRLTVGHTQHVMLFDTFDKRDAARAETLMREHSRAILNYEDIFVQGHFDQRTCT